MLFGNPNGHKFLAQYVETYGSIFAANSFFGVFLLVHTASVALVVLTFLV